MKCRAAPGPALLLLAGLLFAGGCAAKPARPAQSGDASPPPPAAGGAVVAVAPLEIRVNDVEASEAVREGFVEELRRIGWNVMRTEESDRILRESLGITVGGQLRATTPGEVCRVLGVAGVFYGEVTEYAIRYVIVSFLPEVEVSFRLYSGGGRILWEETFRLDPDRMPPDPLLDASPRPIFSIDRKRWVREMGNFRYLLRGFLSNPMSPLGKLAGIQGARRVPRDSLPEPGCEEAW